ncbi:MAG: IS1380 family transposase [Gammaproteobacteria bacterium]|nr:IS1380 family transposase [Gammaproteobacteria bacterium]
MIPIDPLLKYPGQLAAFGRQASSLKECLPEVKRQLLQVSLGTRDQVTLDIDATVIHAKKKSADRTYKGKRGFTPMVGHIAETSQVVHAELRKGNVPPSARNVEFLQHCIEALPEGVRVSKFRADAASDQAAVINLCREQETRFAIRAKMSQNVRGLIAEILESEWQPVVDEDGSLSETEFLARTLHTMGETLEAFCLVVQKTRVPRKVKPQNPDTSAQPEQVEIAMQEQQLNPIDGESAQKDGYIYHAIATDLEGLSDAEIVWWYNQRANDSENRLKELRSNFSGPHLPGSTFRANAVYLYLNGIAYNVLVLLRMKLGLKWYGNRAGTFRSRLYDMAGLIVRHSRQWVLKVNPTDRKLLDETLWMIRTCRLL